MPVDMKQGFQWYLCQPQRLGENVPTWLGKGKELCRASGCEGEPGWGGLVTVMENFSGTPNHEAAKAEEVRETLGRVTGVGRGDWCQRLQGCGPEHFLSSHQMQISLSSLLLYEACRVQV